MTFITVLAWMIGAAATVYTALLIMAWWSYSEINQIHDKMRGFQRTFPITKPAFIAIVCWAWIISTYL